MARTPRPVDAAPKEKKRRFARIRDTFRMARQVDPKIGWISLAVFLGSLAVVVLVAALLGQWASGLVIGIPLAMLVTVIVFGRRVESASYRMVEGRPGAAAGVLESLKRGWTTTPAVAVTKEQDMVHRTVGRPGIILVAEGSPHRVNKMLVGERKRHARVAYQTPVVEIVVGDGEGQVPLRRLGKHVRKLEKKLTPGQVTELNARLRALGSQPIPMPKGPLPKNLKVPRPPRG